MLKILLTVCLCGILPLFTDQFPAGESFRLLLYPGSVLPHPDLRPMTTFEQNTPQADHSKISPHIVYKPLNTNSAFLQPVIRSAPGPAQGPAPDPTHGPAPDLQTLPPKSSALHVQTSNFLPSNFPMQVYSFVQQAVISASDSSEEEATAQVIYMIPVSVESSNMGVAEGTGPDPDPGHLHVGTTPTAVTAAAQPEAQGQLGETVGPETGMEMHSGKNETLIDHQHTRGTQPKLSIKHKSLSPAGNIRK